MTRNGVYTRSPCLVCRKSVTNSGRGYVSHMRAHVRRGEATEHKVRYGPYDYGYRFEPIARVQMEAHNQHHE